MKQFLRIFILSIFTINTHATTHQVNAGMFYYNPSSLTITVGDTVVWINDGGNHDVNGNISAISGESFNNPESFSSPATNVQGATIHTQVFNLIGTYEYDCTVGNHALQGMTGTIVVEGNGNGTVVDIIVNSEIHSTLETAVTQANLVEYLNGDGPFTVFAPSDDAFEGLPDGTLDVVLANQDVLLALLKHHVHGDLAVSSDLSDGLTIETLNDDELTVSVDGDVVMIDMSTVTVVDILADNGVVHVIDKVLMPEIDTAVTVMDIIETSPFHTTLELALIEAELDGSLSGDGPFTVFAPTDDAFDNLADGTLDALLDDIPQLTSILLHHVHPDKALSENLMDGMEVNTMNNDTLIVSIDGETVMIDMATVTQADIEADNGVVHVIDMVLLPDSDPASIELLNTLNSDEYMYSINLLGEVVDKNSKGILLFDIYTNGKTIKRYNLSK